MIFSINIFTSKQTFWFLWPCGVLILVMITVHELKIVPEPSVPRLAISYFAVLNTLSFLQWIRSPDTFPWWIVVFFVGAIPPSIAMLRYRYHEFRVWIYICVTVVYLSCLTFFIWGVVNNPWKRVPWFLFEWIPAAILVGFLWWTNRLKDATYEDVTDETFTGSPEESPNPAQYSPQYMNSAYAQL